MQILVATTLTVKIMVKHVEKFQSKNCNIFSNNILYNYTHYTKPPTRNIKYNILSGFLYANRLTIVIYKRSEINHLLVSKSVLVANWFLILN